MRLAYRLTLYQPRSVDPTETTPLTPIAGAPHSEPFRVATIPGVAGFRHYLDLPRGRAGKVDPLTKRTDTGEILARLLDRRTGADNLERWVSAFAGDERGRDRLTGLRAVWEESTDGGASWHPWFAGRVHSPRLSGRQWIELSIRDVSAELDADIFVGRPHGSITYAASPLAPNGPWQKYGVYPAARRFRGVVRQWSMAGLGSGYHIELVHYLVEDQADVITDALWQLHWLTEKAADPVNRRVRVWVEREDSGISGEFWLRLHPTRRSFLGDTIGYDVDSAGHHRLVSAGIEPLHPADPAYMPVPPAGTIVRWGLLSAAPASEAVPLVISDVDPVVFLADLLDGKFGYLHEDGSPLRTFARDLPSFAALQGKLPRARCIIAQPAKLNDWIEKYLLARYHLGYRIDAQGRFVLLDLRRPASLAGIPTITQADLRVDTAPGWRRDSARALTSLQIAYYQDELIAADEIRQASSATPEVRPCRLRSSQLEVRWEDFERELAGEQKIDAVSARTTPDETLASRARADVVREQLHDLIAELRSPYRGGPAITRLPVRRGGSAADCQVGSWRIVDIDEPPNPAINRRGGPRLAVCTERSEHLGELELEFVDAGADAVAAAPTPGALSLHAGEGRHAVDIAAAPNAAGEAVAIYIAVTATSVAVRPAADDAAWHRAGTLPSSGTLVVRRLPAGMRVWVRMRTESASTDRAQLPSQWVYPAASRIDTQAIPAPTGLAVTAHGQGYRGTWTHPAGAAGYAVMPLLDGEPARTFPLPPGSSVYVWEGVAAGAHTVGVRYMDGWGGQSAATTAVVGTAAPLQLAEPRAIWVRQGRTEAGRESLVPEAEAAEYGIEVGIAPAEPTAQIRLQLSRAAGFGAIDFERTLPAGADVARLATPLDDVLRYVRARHEREGYTESEWSSVVSARPTLLRATASARDAFASGYATLARRADGHAVLTITTSDRDTDRAYYRLTVNPAADWVPAVGVSDPQVPRSAFVAGAVTVDLGAVPETAALAVAVGFFSDASGFGQIAHDRVPGTVLIPPIPDDPPTAQIDIDIATADSWRVTYRGALGALGVGPRSWRRRVGLLRTTTLWGQWGPGPGEGWTQTPLPAVEEYETTAKYSRAIELEVRDDGTGLVARDYKTLPARMDFIDDDEKVIVDKLKGGTLPPDVRARAGVNLVRSDGTAVIEDTDVMPSGGLVEDFRVIPPGITTSGVSIVPVDGVAGGTAIQVAGVYRYWFPAAARRIPFREDRLYRLRVRARVVQDNTDGSDNALFYAGIQRFTADGTLVTEYFAQLYIVAAAQRLTVADGWREFTGWLRGRGTQSTTSTPTNPSGVHDTAGVVAFIAPIILFNYNSPSGQITQVDYFEIVALDEDASQRVYAGVEPDGKVKPGLNDLDRLTDGLTYGRPRKNYLDASGRPTKLRDEVAGVDVPGADARVGKRLVDPADPGVRLPPSELSAGNLPATVKRSDGGDLESTAGAQAKADAARTAAEAFALAKAALAQTQAQAYADGIVTAEEQRAIADAQAKADAAQAAAIAASDPRLHVGTAAPADTSRPWLDTTGGKHVLKRHIAGAWQVVADVTSQQTAANTAAVGDRSAYQVSRGLGQVYFEEFRECPTVADWLVHAGSITYGSIIDEGITGGKALRSAGYMWLQSKHNIPFDPSKLYRIRARVRLAAEPTTGGKGIYVGVAGVAGDGVTLVNATGQPSTGNQHYLAAMNLQLSVADGWREVTGFFRGTAATGTLDARPNPTAPAQLHEAVRYIRPVFILNYADGNGTADIDYIAIDVLDEDASQRVYSAIEASGESLTPAVRQDGKVLAKGYYVGVAKHGEDVMFPAGFFSSPPMVIVEGGIVWEPRTEGHWSDNAFDPDSPVYRDVQAINVTKDSFEVRARLRQKKAATLSTRTAVFPANNLVDAAGASVAIMDLTNVPAYDDTYSISGRVQLSCTSPYPKQLIYQAQMVIAVETRADGATWEERATRSFVAVNDGSLGPAEETFDFDFQIDITVAGFSAGTDVRLIIRSLTGTYGTRHTLHGYDGLGGDLEPYGMLWRTTTPGSERTTSVTPDPEDYVIYRAIETTS